MTTEIALIDDSKYDAALMAALGFGRPGGGQDDLLPMLKINTDHVVEVEHEDGSKEDVSVVAGCFKVRKDGVDVYSMKNPVTMRIFMQRFDFREYDDNANDGKGGYVGHSILFNNGEEPIDDRGTVALGKLRGKAAKSDNLSPEQKIIQKKVGSFRILFGTVTFKGKTAAGDDVEVTDYPVQMRLRGVNFIPVGDVLKELEKRKVIPMSVPITLKTRRDKKGTTTFYHLEFEYDVSKRVPITKDDITLTNTFIEHIRTYNAGIKDKHKEALENRSAATKGDPGGLDDDFGEEPDDSGTEID